MSQTRTPTITLINPDLPVCWEDADTLRIGFERAEARVRVPSAGVQRLLAMLSDGVSSDGIAHSARAVGATPQETRALLHELEPALQVETPPTRNATAGQSQFQLRAALFDSGRAVPGLRRALEAVDAWTLDAPYPPERCELIFHVERYLEPLEFAQRWQGAGVPHLLIRYTDRAVHVGPLIDCAPGSRSTGPCHSCLSLAKVAEDAGIPALAAQLWGKRPQSETSAAAELTVALITLLVRRWLAHDPAVHATVYTIPMARGGISGMPSSASVSAHPACGCQGLA